jgi:hypothetical protein
LAKPIRPRELLEILQRFLSEPTHESRTEAAAERKSALDWGSDGEKEVTLFPEDSPFSGNSQPDRGLEP